MKSTIPDLLLFRGCVDRQTYLAAYLLMGVIWLFGLIFISLLFFERVEDLYGDSLAILIGFVVMSLVFAYFSAVLSAARLRDAGLSRWRFTALPLTTPVVWWSLALPPALQSVLEPLEPAVGVLLVLNLIAWLIVGLWPPRNPQEG